MRSDHSASGSTKLRLDMHFAAAILGPVARPRGAIFAVKQPLDVAIQPVRQSRIYTEIVDQVLRLIKSGNVEVGDRLPSERQLAQQLSVSRSALREAMTALEVLGVVEIKPGVG